MWLIFPKNCKTFFIGCKPKKKCLSRFFQNCKRNIIASHRIKIIYQPFDCVDGSRILHKNHLLNVTHCFCISSAAVIFSIENIFFRIDCRLLFRRLSLNLFLFIVFFCFRFFEGLYCISSEVCELKSLMPNCDSSINVVAQCVWNSPKNLPTKATLSQYQKIHINNSFTHGKNLECVKSTFMQCVCDALTNFDRKSVKSRNTSMWGASINIGLKCRAFSPPTLILADLQIEPTKWNEGDFTFFFPTTILTHLFSMNIVISFCINERKHNRNSYIA